LHDLVGRAELGEQAVDRRSRGHGWPSFTSSASGRIVRISKMEIAGRKRTNRKMRVAKSPRGPRKPAESYFVPAYIPQDEGRKSRCRLVTMITNRSSHMPMLTTNDITNSTPTFVRRFFTQSRFGATTLQRMRSQ